MNRLLERWSAHTDVSVTFLKLVTYCLSALVAIAAVVIVVREIKAAGVGRRARRMAQAKSASASQRWRRISNLPLVPGLRRGCLGGVAARPGPAGYCSWDDSRADRSLTHRELVARSVFESEEQRAAFAGVAYGR